MIGSDAIERRLAGRWSALIALTLVSWACYDGAGWLTPTWAGGLALGLAAVKIRIVILDFMGVRDAPWWLRLPLELWPILLGGAMIALFVMTPA